MQVKIVPVTGIQLDASKVEFVTNVPVTKGRSQPVIRVLMSNGPLMSELHGTCTVNFCCFLYNLLYICCVFVFDVSDVLWLHSLKCVTFKFSTCTAYNSGGM